MLIEVDTAGVGSWDAAIRGGWSPPGGRIKFPYVLGYEGSGTVVSLGSRIHRFKIGDHVYAYSWNNPKGGFYAEYTAVPAEKVAPIPKKLDLFHAGAIPITGLTALQGIDDVLELKRDEHILIHGASGGVGTLAIQFARLRHARVFAFRIMVSFIAQKKPRCLKLGVTSCGLNVFRPTYRSFCGNNENVVVKWFLPSMSQSSCDYESKLSRSVSRLSGGKFSIGVRTKRYSND